MTIVRKASMDYPQHDLHNDYLLAPGEMETKPERFSLFIFSTTSGRPEHQQKRPS